MASTDALVVAARNGDAAADRLLTMLAAGGGLTAQRDLLTLLVGDPADPEQRQLHERSFEEVVRAEVLARFCALRGNNLDVRRLAGILCRMADTAANADDRMAFAIEATGLLRQLADEGDGVASDHLARVVAMFPEVAAGLRYADLATAPAVDACPSGAQQTLGDLLVQALGPDERTHWQRLRDWIGFQRFRLEWVFLDCWNALRDRIASRP